jgi:iron complex transport system substrate-binding protein
MRYYRGKSQLILVALLLLLAAWSGGTSTATAAQVTPAPEGRQIFGQLSDYTYPEYDAEPPIFTVVSETETTLVVRDAWGEVSIPKNPQRIFVLDELALDILLGIGIKPVGVVGRYFEGRMEGVEVLPGWEPNFEAILELEPDLIVSIFGWTNDYREGLSKIAPTLISYPGAFPFWRQTTLDLSNILGHAEQGQQLLADYDAAVAAALDDLPPGLRDGSEGLAVLSAQIDSLRIYGVGFQRDDQFYPTNVTQVPYADLRLTPPEIVRDVSQLDVGGGYREISLEVLPEIESEHLLLYVIDPEKGTELENSPLFQSMPAVQQGNVYRLPGDSLALGPVNMLKRLEEFIQVVNAN